MAQNFGDRLVGSMGWFLIGVLVFLGSFVVLYKTEGRADLSIVADKAIEVEKAGEDEGIFVYETGELQTSGYLSDDLYVIQGDYIVLDRTVEMYAWVEEKHTDEDETYYTYSTAWVEDVPNSDEFDEPHRHENPSKPDYSKRYIAEDASVGDYEINIDKVGLPGLEALELNEGTTDIYGYAEIVSDKDRDYIFDGYGTLEDPDVGDIRYSYSVLHTGKRATVFGKLSDGMIEAHNGEQEGKVYRIFSGSKGDAQSVLKGEYETAGWAGKIGSFFLMWIGLLLILKPLTVSLELIPFLGKLGKSALGIITFVIALILTMVSSFIFSMVQSVLGLVVIAVVVIAVGIYVNTMKQSAVS